MKCDYGCDNDATYELKNGKWCCKPHYSSCPVSKKKNSDAIKLGISEQRVIPHTERYKNASDDSKKRMNWNKGKFTNTLFEYRGKGNHRGALIKERGHKCEVCNNTKWNGKSITLELEHIDGDKLNNVKDNLKLLCPNCHSQTSTWRRRKTIGKNKKYTDAEMVEAIKTSHSMTSTLNKLNLSWGSYTTILKVMKKYNIDLSVWSEAINQQSPDK
jgi:hypothetical protein